MLYVLELVKMLASRELVIFRKLVWYNIWGRGKDSKFRNTYNSALRLNSSDEPIPFIRLLWANQLSFSCDTHVCCEHKHEKQLIGSLGKTQCVSWTQISQPRALFFYITQSYGKSLKTQKNKLHFVVIEWSYKQY